MRGYELISSDNESTIAESSIVNDLLEQKLKIRNEIDKIKDMQANVDEILKK